MGKERKRETKRGRGREIATPVTWELWESWDWYGWKQTMDAKHASFFLAW